jgi:hypothetical protein
MTSALEFSSSWSLGEDAYCAIRDDLRAIGAKRIVEFGSGTSTLRFSRDLPDAQIFSIEGDAHYLEETGENLRAHGGPASVELVHRPIRWQRHGLGWFRSYEPGAFPEHVDAVLIDGPPIATRRGREACLYQVFERCRAGTRFYLDDYGRDAEKQIVLNWLRAFPDALVQRSTILFGHQVAVLERVSDDFARRAHWRNTADSFIQTTKQLLRP